MLLSAQVTALGVVGWDTWSWMQPGPTPTFAVGVCELPGWHPQGRDPLPNQLWAAEGAPFPPDWTLDSLGWGWTFPSISCAGA